MRSLQADEYLTSRRKELLPAKTSNYLKMLSHPPSCPISRLPAVSGPPRKM